MRLAVVGGALMGWRDGEIKECFTFDGFGGYWGVLWTEVMGLFRGTFNQKMRFENWEKFTSGMKSKRATHPVIFLFINGLAII